MRKYSKTAYEVLEEKYQDRGWGPYKDEFDTSSHYEPIEPLTYSEAEYRALAYKLAKQALQEQNPELCELYFELQRRAIWGNHYSRIDDLEEIEEQLFSIGTGEVTKTTENEETYKHHK